MLPRGKRSRRLAAAGLVFLVLTLVGVPAGMYAWAEHHLRQAERALEQHDHREARRHLAEHLKIRPGHARAQFLAARAARRCGLHDEAAEHLRACSRLGWDEQAIDLERLLGYLQWGEPGIEPLLRQRLDELGPGSADELEVLEGLAQHYLDSYQLYEALHCLNRYLQRRPSDLQALLGRAYVWERLLYFRDALGDYRLAVEHHPDSDTARLRLARTLLIAGTPGEAREQFQYLYERGPDRMEVRLGLAQSLRRLGEHDQARRLLDELLREHPADADVSWERGQLAQDEGQLDRAEEWLREAARRAPHERKAQHSLAQLLRRRGKHREADEVAARVRQIDENLAQIDRLTRAVMKSPGDAGLRCQVGLLFLRNGQEAEGVRWLTQALRLDPSCAEARQALAEHARRARPGRDKEP